MLNVKSSFVRIVPATVADGYAVNLFAQSSLI